MTIDITTIMIVMGVPTAVTGICFHFLKLKLEKKERKEDERELRRLENEYLVLSSIRVTMALAEATAKAMRDGKTNGDMTAALYEVVEVKRVQQEFLHKQAIDHLSQ